jgi:GNAT superfamily N-acetyltransferase
VIRQATSKDVEGVSEVFVAARAQMEEFLPVLHTEEEHRGFVRELLLPTHEVWVAEEDGRIVGMAALKDDVLGHLYVHPAAQKRGVGTALMERTKVERPHGFTLWTHQPNERARRFYDAHGLEAVELTDGQGNMEKVPDVRYAWRGA